MKQTGFKTKAFLTLIVTLLLLGATAVVSFAADSTKALNNSYGQIVPTDAKLSAQKSSYTFYGDSTELYFMRLSKGKSDAYYSIEIYSDKAYTKSVTSVSGKYEAAGNKALKVNWNFKSLASGTYYGKCYTYIQGTDSKTVDSDSIKTFTVKINRVGKTTVSLKSVTNTTTGVNITWGTLPTATKYRVYRKAPGDTSWTALRTLPKGVSSYTDPTAKSGVKYTYTVKAFDGDYESLYNKTGLSVTYLTSPTLKSAAATTSAGYAKITWSKVSGASGYYIYRKGGSLSNSSWKRIATVTSGSTVSYTDKTATSTDWQYTYTVRAYKGSALSSFYSSGISFSYLKAPSLKEATITASGVKLSWSDSNNNVTSFNVYRKTASSDWTKIGTTKNKYFTDSTAVSGNNYFYTVKAVCKTNAGAYNPDGISFYFLATPELTSVSVNTSENTVLKWNKVAGATGYRVYRKSANDSSWTRIKDISSGSTLSYTDTYKKTSGTKYTYTVRATRGSILGYYDTAGISHIFLAKPAFTLKNTSTAESNTAVNITWSAVDGAKSYHIYRRLPGESSWTRIQSNYTGLSYTDSSAVSGITYQYTVKALNGSSAGTYKAANIVAVAKPVLNDVSVTDSGAMLSWDAVDGADTYYIYRKVPGANWSLIGSYSLNTFTDTSEEAKTEAYLYSVVAEAEGFKSDRDENGTANYAETTDITLSLVEDNETKAAEILVSASIDNADAAEIFRSCNGSEPVSLGVVPCENGVAQYSDTDIERGAEYTYTCVPVNNTKVCFGKSSSSLKVPYLPIEAVEFTLNPTYNAEQSYVTITFGTVEFADAYEIYRRTEADSEWELIKSIDFRNFISIETVVYTDKTVEEEIKYYYTVKGVASDRDSLYNEEGLSTTVLTPISAVEFTLEPTYNAEQSYITITFGTVKYADAYEIYRRTEADSEWELIGTIGSDEALVYTDNTVEEEVKYYYTVKGIASGRDSLYNEEGLSTTVLPPISAVEFTLESTYNAEQSYVTITFGAVEFADAYEIYRRTEADSEWELIATIGSDEALVYTDNTVEEEIKYYYTVKGIASGRDSLYNEEGLSTTVLTQVAPVTNITVVGDTVDGKPAAVITWDEAEYTQYYRVYRKTADSDWEVLELILRGDPLTYTDTTVEEGVEYIYTVSAAAAGRGEASDENGVSFCWVSNPEETPDPEETPNPEEIPA